MRIIVIMAALSLSACAQQSAFTDAGCTSYGEARLTKPDEPLPPGAWGEWVARTDDRMTGTCR